MTNMQTINRKKTALGCILALLLLLAGGGLFTACSFISPTIGISAVEETVPFIPVEAGSFDFSSIRIALKKDDGSVVERQASIMMLSSADRAKLNTVGTHNLVIRYDGQETNIVLSVYPRGEEPSYTLRFYVLPQGVPAGSTLTPLAEFTQLVSQEFPVSSIPAIPEVSGYEIEGWTVTDFSRLRVDTNIFAGYMPSEHTLSFTYICKHPENCTEDCEEIDGQWWITTQEITRLIGDSIGSIPAEGIERNKPHHRLKGWVDQNGDQNKLYTASSLFDKNGNMVLKAVYEPILIDRLELVTLFKTGTDEAPQGLTGPNANYNEAYLKYLKKNFSEPSDTPYSRRQFEEERTVYNYFNSFGNGTAGIYIKAYREYRTEFETFFYIPVDSQTPQGGNRGTSMVHEDIDPLKTGMDPITGKKLRVVVETTSAATGPGSSIFQLSGAPTETSQYKAWAEGENLREMSFRYYVQEEDRTVGNVIFYQPRINGEYKYTLYRIFKDIKLSYVDSSDRDKGWFDFGWDGINPNTLPTASGDKEAAITQLTVDNNAPQPSLWIFVYISGEGNMLKPEINCVPPAGQAQWAGLTSYGSVYDATSQITTWAYKIYSKDDQPVGNMNFTVKFVNQ